MGKLLLLVVAAYLLPVVVMTAWWCAPRRWHLWDGKDCGPTGLLPPPSADGSAAVYLLSARTSGLKGALSVHSWIVTKPAGAHSYTRFDKVGWGGEPILRDAYPPDGRWYSNEPMVIYSAHGMDAEPLIVVIEQAVRDYPHRHQGGYRIWPGPNSNSFIAHVLRAVPELGALPPNAVGRDWRSGLVSCDWCRRSGRLHLTLCGLFGFSLGVKGQIEFHLLGLVAGIDLARPAFLIPAKGRVELRPRRSVSGIGVQRSTARGNARTVMVRAQDASSDRCPRVRASGRLHGWKSLRRTPRSAESTSSDFEAVQLVAGE